MSSTNPSEPSEPLEHEELAELLDRYVESIQSGDYSTSDGLIQQYPELNQLIECLHDLDSLAPSPSANPQDFGDAETIISDSGTPIVDDQQSNFSTSVVAMETFGKYELIEEVGRGGMGVVYKAQQTDLDRTVAIKMILANQFASAEEVRRFYDEARAAGSLQHANIIGIHEVGEVHGQHYFAMDYVEGTSLSDLIRKRALDHETAAKCLATIARAVDYLHTRQIVHRDLKPSNILVDIEGNPFVTDFGLAKIFQGDSQHTRTGTIVGTPSYMAPEQAAGQTAEISPRSDVYSLGSILYEVLTGRPPFREENPLDTLVQVLEGEPSLPRTLDRSIPRELELICMRCLEKEPDQRYSSANALADDLDRFARREPIQASPSGLRTRIRRWVRREPAFVSRLVALGVATTIVQVRFMLSDELLQQSLWGLHLKILSVFAVWGIVSFVFQKLLNREQLADAARFGWAAADAILLTTIFCMIGETLGTLLIGYPLLVAASGLFFRVRLVWFTTLVCLISYAALLLLVGYPQDEPMHYPIIFASVLAVLGFIVAYQVYRVRVLSRFYENRRLP